MTLRRFLAAAVLAMMPGIAQSGSQAQDPAYGYWLTANGKAIVELAPCGGATCGKMVWIDNPLDESGQPKLDVRNADVSKRARPICGLALLGGLDRAAPGDWDDGWIYNPRDGSTYSVDVESVSANELKVRGYLGLKVLGSSQIWTRVDAPRDGCI